MDLLCAIQKERANETATQRGMEIDLAGHGKGCKSKMDPSEHSTESFQGILCYVVGGLLATLSLRRAGITAQLVGWSRGF